MSTQKDIDAIIASVVAQVVAEREASKGTSTAPTCAKKKSAGGKRALVFFMGAVIGLDEALVQLKSISESGIQLDYAMTPAAEHIIDRYKLVELGIKKASTEIITSHDLLILPNLTVNTVAKVVQGIGDSIATNIIAEFIMSNRPVFGVKDAACPDSAGKKEWFPSMPPGYQQMLRDNLSKMASFGVTMVPVRDLAKAVLEGSKP